MGQEQRREARLRSRGEVVITRSGMPGVRATVYDTSHSGLGLLAASDIPAGSIVSIESHLMVADGVVRYSRPVEDQFLIGVALK